MSSTRWVEIEAFETNIRGSAIRFNRSINMVMAAVPEGSRVAARSTKRLLIPNVYSPHEAIEVLSRSVMEDGWRIYPASYCSAFHEKSKSFSLRSCRNLHQACKGIRRPIILEDLPFSEASVVVDATPYIPGVQPCLTSCRISSHMTDVDTLWENINWTDSHTACASLRQAAAVISYLKPHVKAISVTFRRPEAWMALNAAKLPACAAAAVNRLKHACTGMKVGFLPPF